MSSGSGVRRVEVLGLSLGEIALASRQILQEAAEPAYRERQIRDWIYRRTPDAFSSMSDLPRGLRERLERSWDLHPLEVAREESSRDGTRKLLWRRREGDAIESVIIPDRDRRTYCISTQAGCPVRCTFCATGHGGFRGQLRAAEIVDQVLSMRRIDGAQPTNVVYMGMGEPLLNLAAVLRSLEILTGEEQVGFGARRITVSTVGIPEGIRELARSFPQVKLALSLHSARDEKRSSLVPLNARFGIEAILTAVRDHVRLTGKKVTFEYVILPGVNDGEDDAREVIRAVREIPARINLIGFNPFPGSPYGRPLVARLLQFRKWLARGFPGDVTIRRSRGRDIQGACGQLSASPPA